MYTVRHLQCHPVSRPKLGRGLQHRHLIIEKGLVQQLALFMLGVKTESFADMPRVRTGGLLLGSIPLLLVMSAVIRTQGKQLGCLA